MAALYPFSFLNHIDTKDIEVPLKRYLYKFENHRKEIAHLKHHEKDFLFRCLKILRKETGGRGYDLFHIPEAKEFLFDWIILIHANQVMVFDGHIQGPYGRLTQAEITQNKGFFYKYLAFWKEEVEKGEGAYLTVIKPALYQKIEDWKAWADKDKRRKQQLIRKLVYVYATFFHIYYRVKLFFDERTRPYVLKQIGGYDVVFNVYSFVHILSRHYYPNMNMAIGVSLNTELDSINLDYLPDEIMALIEKSNNESSIVPQTEYLLYSIGSDYYILWLKYKRLNETHKDGFEVRSFYKCEEQRDLDKINAPGACVITIR